MILYANTQPYFLYKASKPLPRGHNGTTGTKSISTTIQDVDLVKLLILYIVFYKSPTRENMLTPIASSRL